MDSPGGWQLIGRTPLLLFDPNRPGEEFLLQAGGPSAVLSSGTPAV